jgi:hypothetical protein
VLKADRCSETNQIQREFLFNVRIATQEFSSASSPPRQKTNLFKPRRAVTSRRRKEACCQSCRRERRVFTPCPCEAGEGLGMGDAVCPACEAGRPAVNLAAEKRIFLRSKRFSKTLKFSKRLFHGCFSQPSPVMRCRQSVPLLSSSHKLSGY